MAIEGLAMQFLFNPSPEPTSQSTIFVLGDGKCFDVFATQANMGWDALLMNTPPLI